MGEKKIAQNKKILSAGDIIKVRFDKTTLCLVCIDNNFKSDKIYYKFENLQTTQTSLKRRPFNTILFYTREELLKLIHSKKLRIIEDIPEKAYILLMYR